MDNVELIEKFEHDLWRLISKAHKDGISFETAHYILQEMVKSLDIMGYSEDWLKQFLSPDLTL